MVFLVSFVFAGHFDRHRHRLRHALLLLHRPAGRRRLLLDPGASLFVFLSRFVGIAGIDVFFSFAKPTALLRGDVAPAQAARVGVALAHLLALQRNVDR